MRRIVRALFVTAISLVLVPVTIMGILFVGFIVLPLPASLPEPRPLPVSQPTEIFDSKGTLIATFRPFEQSFPVNKSDIPQVLKDAIIAVEDRRFYDHGGIDPKGIARALVKDLRGEAREGGSTITQQYVKQAYTGDERTIARKVREAVLASQLDRQVDKEEILYRYMSTIFLGNGIYGVGAAAESYFRKPISQLTLGEAALLAGIIPAPTRYEPRGNPTNAERRRVLSLKKMLEQSKITQAQYDEVVAQPIWLDAKGPAPTPSTLIYSSKSETFRHPYFVDYVRRSLVEKYGQAGVYGGGLSVVTTLDPFDQQAADDAVNNAIGKYAAPLEMSLVSVEPQTGFVKAFVGGRDFSKSSVNLGLGGCPAVHPADTQVEAFCWDNNTVTGGGTGRQPGSSFKPFVLAAALKKGIDPSKSYSAPVRFYPPGCKKQSCSIGNASDGEGGGFMSLKDATVHSVNTVYAQLVREVGFVETATLAQEMGLNSIFYAPSFQGDSGTFALGTTEVSPLDIASAYGVFANRGLRQAATPILTVVDKAGQVLEDNTNRTPKKILDENVADNVTKVLEGVINSGTGKKADIKRPAAGKTGTTNDYKDAWFVGYTPTLSTAVWMGYSDKPRTMRLRGVGNVFGGTLPAPVWSAYMKKALQDVPVTDFTEPAPIKRLSSVDAKKLAQDASAASQDLTLLNPSPANQQRIAGTEKGGPYIQGQLKARADAAPTTTSAPYIVPVIPSDDEEDQQDEQDEP